MHVRISFYVPIARVAETFFGWLGREKWRACTAQNFLSNDIRDYDVITVGREHCSSRFTGMLRQTRQRVFNKTERKMANKQVSPRTHLSFMNKSCSLMRQKSGPAKT